jgi:nicotinamidase-related amidase
MLLSATKSLLLLLDVQTRLVPALSAPDTFVEKTVQLLQGAQRLNIPILLTQQYPQGLGPTLPELQSTLGQAIYQTFDKTAFSAWQDPAIAGFLRAMRQHQSRHQVLIAGLESHICVLQTALDLVQEGFEVFVAQEATASRNPMHHESAMERLRQADVTSALNESALFEWLRDAKHPSFKAIQALVK